MSSALALRRRIDKMLAAVHEQLHRIIELPKRMLRIDASGKEEVLYETPDPDGRFKKLGIAYKEYINMPEDGIDP